MDITDIQEPKFKIGQEVYFDSDKEKNIHCGMGLIKGRVEQISLVKDMSSSDYYYNYTFKHLVEPDGYGRCRGESASLVKYTIKEDYVYENKEDYEIVQIQEKISSLTREDIKFILSRGWTYSNTSGTILDSDYMFVKEIGNYSSHPEERYIVKCRIYISYKKINYYSFETQEFLFTQEETQKAKEKLLKEINEIKNYFKNKEK